MGLTFRVQTFGQDIVHRQLMRFADELRAPHEGLRTMGDIMRRAVFRQFESEGSYATGGWKELTPERIAYKRSHGLDPHILRATRRLMYALTLKTNSEHIERLSGSSLTFGASVPYLIFHQRGTRKMPARPPIAVRPEDKREMGKRLQRSILERSGIKAAA